MNKDNKERNIDIIIPTYLRGEILIERLPSYFNQKEAKSIFVIDSGENTDTESAIKIVQEKSPIPIFYHRFPKHEVQQVCKNFGVIQSKAPYIFIGEDDLELSENHFAILLETLSRRDVDIVGGRRVYIRDGETQAEALINAPTHGKIFCTIPFEAYFENLFENEIIVPYLHSNVLIKRDVFDSVQYDSRYKGNAFREELDFYLGCLKLGKKMLATPHTACFHLKSDRKMHSGSQTVRLKYEAYVWINTIKCFWKNRDVLKSNFQMKLPTLYAIASLFARYTNGLSRRLKKYFKYERK